MLLLLPLLFVIFIISFPAGLILYWITTNTWTMGQQWVIRGRSRPVVPVRPVAPSPSSNGRDARLAAMDGSEDGSSGGGGFSGPLRGKPKPEERQPAAVGSTTRARREARPAVALIVGIGTMPQLSEVPNVAFQVTMA